MFFWWFSVKNRWRAYQRRSILLSNSSHANNKCVKRDEKDEVYQRIDCFNSRCRTYLLKEVTQRKVFEFRRLVKFLEMKTKWKVFCWINSVFSNTKKILRRIRNSETFLSQIWIRMKCAAIEPPGASSAPQPNSIARRRSLRFDSSFFIVLRIVSSFEARAFLFVLWSWGLSSFCRRELQSIPLVTWQFSLNSSPARLFSISRERRSRNPSRSNFLWQDENLWFDWENFYGHKVNFHLLPLASTVPKSKIEQYMRKFWARLLTCSKHVQSKKIK